MEKVNAEFEDFFKVESIDSHDCLDVEGKDPLLSTYYAYGSSQAPGVH